MSIRKHDFEHSGRQLTVSAALSCEGWRVRIFENGRPVTGIIYGVHNEVVIEGGTRDIPLDLVDHLMQIAEQDVTKGWVRLF